MQGEKGKVQGNFQKSDEFLGAGECERDRDQGKQRRGDSNVAKDIDLAQHKQMLIFLLNFFYTIYPYCHASYLNTINLEHRKGCCWLSSASHPSWLSFVASIIRRHLSILQATPPNFFSSLRLTLSLYICSWSQLLFSFATALSIGIARVITAERFTCF